ncbi:hypothetical protein [Acaryochloris sp. CCMEE 5410]|uniref:hypothetical protein n=1 Tax=Acaryochloris sp. CCMEE 5410 TaxID=310037 RepID=UPI0002483CCC|nr:hypothetical protein [Acaryochloris sp. CCMEE 5410]KAI9130023.1 hypothetical protein ON05_030715 [Acaryochloris sp. CCMEE 5410]
MFNEVLKEATGILDRRFLLNAFFPCLIFWGLLGIVGVVGSGWEPLKLLQNWNQQDGILQTLEIIGLITLVVSSASVLSSHSASILRFYEGYWKFPVIQRFTQLGKTWHQAQLAKLDVPGQMKELAQQMKQVDAQLSTTQALDQKRSLQGEMKSLISQERELNQRQFSLKELNYRNYPHPQRSDQVMPTRLGNILKNSELYPLERYTIDAVLIWPRLYHSLPDRYIQVITEVRSSLDFSLAIATLSGLFSIMTGLWLLAVKAPGWLFLLCFWGGALAAWLAYQSALGNAVAYSEQVKVCFDLYRHELVKQLRLKPATTPDLENQQWQEIRELFYEGKITTTWQYTDLESKPEGAQNG